MDVRGGVDGRGGVGRRGAGEGGEEVRGVVGEEVEAHEEEEDGHGEADEDFGAFETGGQGGERLAWYVMCCGLCEVDCSFELEGHWG